MPAFCPKPFSHFRVSTIGDVSLCSPGRISIPVVGNVLDEDFDDVWNSALAQEFRRSILDGSFEYCSSQHCPALQKNSLPNSKTITDPRLRKIIDNQSVVLEDGPTELNLHYDRSCNLKCPTCRTDIIGIKGEELDRVKAVKDAVLDGGVFRHAEHITLCGYGEVFASKVHLEMLRTLTSEAAPKLRIKILTNGLLLNERMWASFANCHDMIDEIWVSIDAASQKTYALNRGGNYDKLVHNLDFISSLRRSEKVKSFCISMVVQQNNFREMEDFVRMGTRLHCDRVVFQKIFDSDQAYMDDFEQRAVHLNTHPEYEDFCNVLRSPLMVRKAVDLYTISDSLPPDLKHLVNAAPKKAAKRSKIRENIEVSRKKIAEQPPAFLAQQATNRGVAASRSLDATPGNGVNGANDLERVGWNSVANGQIARPASVVEAQPVARTADAVATPVPASAKAHRPETTDDELSALREENRRLKELLTDAMLRLLDRGYKL